MESDENSEIRNLKSAASDLLKVSKQSLKRVKQVEEAVLLLKEIVLRHDEQHEEQRAVNDDFMFKLNSLIDAQISDHDDIREIKNRLAKLEQNGSKS